MWLLAWLSCGWWAGDADELSRTLSAEQQARLPLAALRLAVVGDAPYDEPGSRIELDRLSADVAAIQDVAMVVHLGDLKTGKTPCLTETYTQAARAMCGAQVPAFVIPGDNEWNDCERTKAQGLDMVEGWRRWNASFGPAAIRCPALEPPNAWQVRIQSRPTYPWWPGHHTGAFQVDRNGVRVIGLALPSFYAKGQGLKGEKGRIVQSVAIGWIQRHIAGAGQDIKAAVVLVHADLQRSGSKQERVVEVLRDAAAKFGRPVLVVVGDSHEYEERRPFDGVDLDYVVITRSGLEAPLTVEVRPDLERPFRLIRGDAH